MCAFGPNVNALYTICAHFSFVRLGFSNMNLILFYFFICQFKCVEVPVNLIKIEVQKCTEKFVYFKIGNWRNENFQLKMTVGGTSC